MNWKNGMSSIEQKSDFKGAINLLEHQNGDDPEIYLRVIFLLLDFVVEGQYTQEEHDYVAEKLKGFFDESRKKFSGNAEFLFFMGIMIYMGEWYFGIDNAESAATMLDTAMRMEPDNTLYKWGYYSRIDQRPEQNRELKFQLSERLLFKETTKLDWLKAKGTLGKYVLGTLEENYEELR